jgi:hypothetical protein
MKNIFLLAAALMLMVGVQSCSDDPASPEPSGPTQITFSQGAEATFTYTRLDTAAGRENQEMPNTRDTVHQETLDTNASHEGKTGVVKKSNHYMMENRRDTMYLKQESNGDLYIHNFGLDLVNSPEVQAIINQPITAGWVLVAKTGASSGTSWTAWLDTVNLINFFNIPTIIKDQVTANGEVTMTINGQSTKVKKFTHNITATAAGSEVARTTIEIYISLEHGGIVRMIRKVSNIALPGQTPMKAVGADMNLVTYTK